MTKIKHIKRLVGWDEALGSARFTVGKESTGKFPSDTWKRKMLLAEHSPIRLVTYSWAWDEIPQWVTTHLVRHHIGCEKFVRTQRTDRTGSPIPRGEHLQGEPNSMMMVANAQEIVAISRVRLCKKASLETRNAWTSFIVELNSIDPILAEKCVPNCVYRGFCPEMESCGFCKTDKYKEWLEEYRKT